jgi:LDH2 family malate/lactate/ureidoglycolate dehydrogenase
VTEKNITIAVEKLQAFMADVLAGVGVPREEAEIAADVLITSDLRGIESHGLGRLKMYYDRIRAGTVAATAPFEVVRELAATAVVDAHYGLGLVAGPRAMRLAIEKARVYGLGAVAVRRSTHFGIDGYYPLMAVKEGMIGMSFTNARPSIAPTFGVKPMLGTNPIAFGAPTDEVCPFLYDAATSITQRGKIEVANRVGKHVPEGWVIDRDCDPVTDPAAILQGFDRGTNALLPLGGPGELLAGYKGYGLAVMVEILSSALQSGAFLYGVSGFDPQGNRIPLEVGHFFLAMNVEAFVALDEFKASTGAILRELRASDKAPGQGRIYTAGEKEYENEQRVREEGVAVNPVLQGEIRAMQEGLGLWQYDFGLEKAG